ncbi:MAG: hypothetical protein HQK79_20795, partial [Desulfobacterales bacterium]|nr:hypothetical protein [Desulfobacterales bacterium]
MNFKHANPFQGLTLEELQEFLKKIAQGKSVSESIAQIIWNASTQESQIGADPIYLKFLQKCLQEGSISLDQPDSIPQSLYQAFYKEWVRLSDESQYLLHKMLAILSIIYDYADDDFFYELFRQNETALKSSLKETISRLRSTAGKLLIYDGERYCLFHDRFRLYVRGNSEIDQIQICDVKIQPKVLLKFHRQIADFLQNWYNFQRNLRTYALKYRAHHLKDLNDLEGLWNLAHEEVYRNAQIDELKNYDATLLGLNIAITCYAKAGESLCLVKSNENEQMTTLTRLCWLILTYGEQGEKAKTDVSKAWEWVREGRMEDALARLKNVDNKYFFQASLYLLMIEADRMEKALKDEIPVSNLDFNSEIEKRKNYYSQFPEQLTRPFTNNAKLVLEQVSKRIPAGSDIVRWYDFMTAEQAVWWVLKVSAIPNILPLNMLIISSYNIFAKEFAQIFNFCLQKHLFEQAKQISLCIKEEKDKVKAFLEIAKATGKAEDYEQVIQTTLSIEDNYYKSKNLLEIAKIKGIPYHYEQAIQTAMSIKIRNEKIKALLEIVEAQAQDRQYEQALKTSINIEDKYCKSQALLDIAKATGDPNHYELALQT